jgi:orotidine-5'-phosphate decarboxylase
MNPNQRKAEIILALDVETRQQAQDVLTEIGEGLRWVKVGLQSFLRDGCDFIRELADGGYEVFLDLKLHDIPNTVAKAIESLAGLPVGMLTMHASAGSECMRSASASIGEHLPGAKLLAVTVLTSLNDRSLREIGVGDSAGIQVPRLAKLAIDAGVGGIVCSPLEITHLRKALPKEALLVTPGIRPSGSSMDEQKRVLSPLAAAELGANYLVIGRPILKSANPGSTFREIMAELNRAVG